MKRFIALVLYFALLLAPVVELHPIYFYAATASAAADITRTQNVSAQTTNVAFSTPTAGDLILVCAHRDGSTTPPTKVAGYTSITKTADPAFANTNSSILAFRFSDGTETGTGTWTNATSIACMIYRNAGLGGWSETRKVGSTSPMTYGTLAMQNTSGTSWVAGFGATKGSTNVGTNAPSGMTTRTSATDIAAFDTGAGVASWTDQTAVVNGTPAGTNTYTLEILAIPANQLLFTFIQHATAVGVASSTTAAVTLTQSVGSEPHILLVSVQYSGVPTEITSIDKGGTLTGIVGTQGGTPGGFGASHGYVIGTTTATTPITVTYAGTNSGTNVSIWEVAYTGTGTPAIDIGNRSYVSSGTSVLPVAATMSGGNDVVFQNCVTDHSVTAIASPYNSPTGYFVAPSGNAWGASFNNSSITTPTWTIDTTGVSGFATVAFGKNPTAFLTQGFSDFEGSSDGTSCTEALLKAGMKGWSIGRWTTQGSGAAMKFATAASKPLINATGRLNDGGNYAAGAGSLGVKFLTSTNNSYLKWDFSNATGVVNGNAFSAGVWFFSDMPGNDASNLDVFSLNANGGTNFANAKFLRNGAGTSRTFHLEVNGGVETTSVDVSASTWYWLTLLFNRSGTHSLKVYESDGTTLKGTCTETHGGSGMPGYVTIGQSSSNTPTTGFFCNFDSLKVDPTGTYPLLP